MKKSEMRGFDRAMIVSTTLTALTVCDTGTFENLLKKGLIDVNIDLGGTTPAHEACKLGYADFLKLLLAHRADFTVRDCLNSLPSDFAMRYGRVECLRLLIAAGVDVQPSLPLYTCMPEEKRGAVLALLRKEVLPALFWSETRGVCYLHNHGVLRVSKNLAQRVCYFLA